PFVCYCHVPDWRLKLRGRPHLCHLALTPLEVEQRGSRDQGNKSASRCCLQLLQLQALED
ncbi:unnamed protein product, partial [Staurois parvus]